MAFEAREIPIGDLELNKGQLYGLPKNPRFIRDTRYEALRQSIEDAPEMLALRELLVYPLEDKGKYIIIGGNMRFRACRDLGHETVPCKVIPLETPVQKLREYTIKDNEGFGQNDWDILANEWDAEELTSWGVENLEGATWGDGDTPPDGEEPGGMETNGNSGASLNDTFVIPPFSVLDTRQGYWQERKRLWRGIIGDMGQSREGTLFSSIEIQYKDLYTRTSAHRQKLGISFREYIDKYVPKDVLEREKQKVTASGVSLFDPVLSEIICRWFTPHKGARIFDCFAGDTQKGVVFGTCGYTFKGVELRKEQVETNNSVLKGRDLPVSYVCDDGQNVARYFEKESQDLLFSCPPYYDLEVYSDLPNDASNQGTYEDFIAILRRAFQSALTCLKPNRFAVVVMGDVRSKKDGTYYDFDSDIKRIFTEAGAQPYNEIVLVETAASVAMRAAKYMQSRKVAKMHQKILVFFKGDTKRITEEFAPVELTDEEQARLAELAEGFAAKGAETDDTAAAPQATE